ncbi:MAG: GFA family protein [Deltaproteobacteria bacterium]|nr:MAG: GFA family protein [Deltaproteobacteria bacterium]
MELREGGCHCGRVRFRVQVERREAIECNCSICTKKGFVHLIVPPDRFELLSGAEVLSTYRFHTETARHHFCRICGIHAFYRPRSHPDAYDVNVRCLDGEDPLEGWTLRPFDGRHWEAHIAEITEA